MPLTVAASPSCRPIIRPLGIIFCLGAIKYKQIQYREGKRKLKDRQYVISFTFSVFRAKIVLSPGNNIFLRHFWMTAFVLCQMVMCLICYPLICFALLMRSDSTSGHAGRPLYYTIRTLTTITHLLNFICSISPACSIGSECYNNIIRPPAVRCKVNSSGRPIRTIQWNSVNSTSDNSKTYLTQTKFHGPCLGNDNLLGISWTDKTAVSAIKLPSLWLDVFTFLCKKLYYIVFFSHEKKISGKF